MLRSLEKMEEEKRVLHDKVCVLEEENKDLQEKVLAYKTAKVKYKETHILDLSTITKLKEEIVLLKHEYNADAAKYKRQEIKSKEMNLELTVVKRQVRSF